MNTPTLILIGFIAVQHAFFLYLEMFAWNSLGRKIFRGALEDDLFSKTSAMAANQGLYNGFLAAGLVWSFFISDPQWQVNVAVFFLSCVLLAGLYGAYSVSMKIFYVQGLPAAAALLLVLTQ